MEFPEWSDYNYVLGNPVMLVDPDGKSASNPIYDDKGNFLDTDDKGLQGKAYVLKTENFVQGMANSEAKSYNLGSKVINETSKNKLTNHYYKLNDRPDYDGYITIKEGIKWAKSHPNALGDNANSENRLYADASKLDFGYIFESTFESVNTLTQVDLFNVNNTFAAVGDWNIRATTYALGRVDLILHDRETREVSIINGKTTVYNWDKGGSVVRETAIKAERKRAGLNDNHGFEVFYYGKGKLADERRRRLGLDRM